MVTLLSNLTLCFLLQITSILSAGKAWTKQKMLPSMSIGSEVDGSHPFCPPVS